MDNLFQLPYENWVSCPLFQGFTSFQSLYSLRELESFFISLMKIGRVDGHSFSTPLCKLDELASFSRSYIIHTSFEV